MTLNLSNLLNGFSIWEFHPEFKKRIILSSSYRNERLERKVRAVQKGNLYKKAV